MGHTQMVERRNQNSSPDTKDTNASSARIPRVRVLQDTDAEPVRVIVVDDEDKTSVGLLALAIFFATLLGTLLGLGADLGELLNTIDEIEGRLNPPPSICVVGSDTILSSNMADSWEEGFEENFEVRLRRRAIGSVDGVRAVENGECVHVLAMSEPMTDDQFQAITDSGHSLQCAAEIGYDVIAFVTNINNPLVSDVRDADDPEDLRPSRRAVLSREMNSILNGRITDWSEVSNWPPTRRDEPHPITIWVRLGSGTTEVVLNRVANYTPTESLPVPPNTNYQVCESNEDCLNKTLETPGSLYWVSVAWMRTQPPDYLSVLSILDGDEFSVNPLRETVNLEEYPRQLIRPLYLYTIDSGDTNTENMALAEDFLRYVRGIEGQVALDEDNFYNHFSRPFDIRVDFPEDIFTIPTSGPRTLCKP